jgi:hypothetical protein
MSARRLHLAARAAGRAIAQKRIATNPKPITGSEVASWTRIVGWTKEAVHKHGAEVHSVDLIRKIGSTLRNR